MLGDFSYKNATKIYFGDESLKYLNEEFPRSLGSKSGRKE